jgi:hypothetical protein
VRRIVLVLILVGVFVVAGYMLLRPKKAAPARGKRSSAAVKDTSDGATPGASKAVKSSAGTKRSSGKVTGSLKGMSKAERKAQLRKIRDEERRRKKELKRAEREKKRMLRAARSRHGRRRGGRKGQFYTLKAVVSLGSESYALIDSRRAQVGDVVMGRKIVAIGADRIEIEAFGRRSTVRVGESLLPYSYGSKRR